MKCRFCKDKATKSIDVTHDSNFAASDGDVFFREEEVVYDSQGTFRPRVDGDEDDKVSLREEEEPAAEDDEKTEIFVCEDHHRLWELLYGGEVVEEQVKFEDLKPEEQQEIEEATQEVHDEIEQIKERIRKKEKER